MAAVVSMAHSLLLSYICKSSTRRSSSTNVKYLPFSRVERATPVEAASIGLAYNQDICPQKVNLAINVYRDGEGKPHVFPAVRKAEIGIACDDFLSHEPMPSLGNEEFTKAANELILGESTPAILQNRVLGVQSRTSIDAMCLAAQFLRQKMKSDVCLLAKPSYQLYEHIFKSVGFTCNSYQYYNETKAELNIYGLVADLMSAPEGSVVILDACAHNPTAIDPSIDEWKLIGHIMKCKKMLPLFHLDMQGLASGDPAQDAWPVRYFVDCGFDLFCAQSFVNNFGLYNEAVSNLMVVLSNPVHLDTVKAQFESMLYNNNEENSAIFASRVVAKILTTDTLRKDWAVTLRAIERRVNAMRLALSTKLVELKTPGSWQHLEEQRGLYSYTSLTPPQIKQLKSRHVYLPTSGRINISALHSSNIDYVAGAINDVVLSKENATDDFFLSDHVQALHHYFNTA